MTTIDDPIEFEIRPEDARRALPRMAAYCLVARALRRTLPGKRVLVSDGRIVIDGAIWFTTKAVREAIHAFDRDRTVRSGLYVLTERLTNL